MEEKSSSMEEIEDDSISREEDLNYNHFFNSDSENNVKSDLNVEKQISLKDEFKNECSSDKSLSSDKYPSSVEDYKSSDICTRDQYKEIHDAFNNNPNIDPECSQMVLDLAKKDLTFVYESSIEVEPLDYYDSQDESQDNFKDD
jgi:hypothetical protein